MSTYYKSTKQQALLDILLYISNRASGATVEELQSEIDITESSLRNYLTLLESKGLVEKQGTRYIVGAECAKMWAKRQAVLKTRVQTAQSELQELNNAQIN